MCEEIITLWTIHSPAFDLTSGSVDHSKSDYYLSVSGVRESYLELWRRLNTPRGQIIWCYTSNDGIVKTGTKKILWKLQIPRENVICFLDNLVWNRILGLIHNVSLRSMHNQWFEEWKKIPDNQTSLEAYIGMREKEFREQKPKTGSWWDELFFQKTGECVDAIIHHPVPKNFVKERITWFCESS